MGMSGSAAQEGMSNDQNRQELLTIEEIESLKEYSVLFDKIMVSKNPAVRNAWKDISLLIGLTEPVREDQSIISTSSRSGPFSRLASQVERSLSISKEINRHVTGLQYQIDELKRENASLVDILQKLIPASSDISEPTVDESPVDTSIFAKVLRGRR